MQSEEAALELLGIAPARKDSPASTWSINDAPKVKDYFRQAFGRDLPVSAYGQSDLHSSWNYDHKDAMDVALHPTSKEGQALISYLTSQGIPFRAFTHAVPGKATGPHVHIGNPSRSFQSEESSDTFDLLEEAVKLGASETTSSVPTRDTQAPGIAEAHLPQERVASRAVEDADFSDMEAPKPNVIEDTTAHDLKRGDLLSPDTNYRVQIDVGRDDTPETLMRKGLLHAAVGLGMSREDAERASQEAYTALQTKGEHEAKVAGSNAPVAEDALEQYRQQGVTTFDVENPTVKEVFNKYIAEGLTGHAIGLSPDEMKARRQMLQTMRAEHNPAIEGFSGAMAGSLVQVGNLLDLVGADEAGKHLTRTGRLAQETTQLAEEDSPNHGLGAELMRGVGAAVPETTKLFLLSPVTRAATLPALGALSHADEGTSAAVAGAVEGAAMQAGMKYLPRMMPAGNIGRAANAAVWTGVPTVQAINEGASPAKALGQALPFGAMALGEGRQAERPVESTVPRREVIKPNVENQPQWNHLNFGLVTRVENQSGVPRDSVRVIDEQGNPHIIKKANGRGAGNQRAIPVRIKPETTLKDIPDIPVSTIAEPRAVKAAPVKGQPPQGTKPAEMSAPKETVEARWDAMTPAERKPYLEIDYTDKEFIDFVARRAYKELIPEDQQRMGMWIGAGENPARIKTLLKEAKTEDAAAEVKPEAAASNIGSEAQEIISHVKSKNVEELNHALERHGITDEDIRSAYEESASPERADIEGTRTVPQRDNEAPGSTVKEVSNNETLATDEGLSRREQRNNLPVSEGAAQGVASSTVPTREEVLQRIQKEKPDKRTGLKPSQKEYLAGELHNVADGEIQRMSEGARLTVKEFAEKFGGDVPADSVSMDFKEPATIKVPGDGEFTVGSMDQANRLHQKITGKPIEGLEKVKGGRVAQAGTPQSSRVPKRSTQDYADWAVSAYGSPKVALEKLSALRQRIIENPETLKEYEREVRDLGFVLGELQERVDASRSMDEVRAPLIKAVNQRIASNPSFKDLKATIDRMGRRTWAGDKESFEKHAAEHEPDYYLDYSPRDYKSQASKRINMWQRQIRQDEHLPLASRGGTDWFAVERQSKPTVPTRDQIVEMHAGLNPAAAIREADDLSIPRGSFTVDRGARGERDFHFLDRFRTPLSNLDFKGTMERIAGPLGKEASDAIRTAQVNISERFREWHKASDEVTAFLERARGSAKKEEFYREFVDLVELPRTDPKRTGTTGDLKKALELHDKLTEDWRKYIIENRRSLGMEMADDWGITEKGYFRHLFLGDIQVFQGSHFIGTAQTYAEAQKIALGVLKTSPDAEIVARARNVFAGDPTVRLSTRQFWKTVGKLEENVELSKADILEDVRGVIGQQRNRQKFFGSLLKREGHEGYSKAYKDVMELHAAQLARTQELTQLNRTLTPIMEQLKREGKPGLAEEIKAHLDDLWGTPTRTEKQIGSLIRQIPVLRNNVPNPDLAFRRLASKVTSLQSLLRLQFNIRSSAVNLLDPLTTLWPYTTTKDFASLYADFLKPSTRQMLRERGVFEGATKLEGETSSVVPKRNIIPRPFEAASEVNRGIGYLHGLKSAKRLGLSGDAAHRHALDWAKKVEFDNSIWNVPPILRSPTGRVLGQFKGYTLKALENVATLSRTHENDSNLSRASRVGKFVTGKGAVGGVKAVTSPVRVLTGYLGYELVVGLSAQFEQYGMSKDDADRTAQAIYYGAPALIGQDLSASVAVLDDLYGNSPEEKIINLLGGPTVGSALTIYKQSAPLRKELSDFRQDPSSEQLALTGRAALKSARNIGTRISPYGKTVDSAVRYYREGHVTVPGAGNQEIELSPFESAMRGVGFTPLRQTKSYDAEDSTVNKPKLSPELRLPVEGERERLKMPLPHINRTFKQDKETVRLTDEQYREYQQKYLELLYKKEAELYLTTQYQKMSDGEKKEAISALRKRVTAEMPPPGKEIKSSVPVRPSVPRMSSVPVRP